jgi:uncharacterized protein (DUF1778 family)
VVSIKDDRLAVRLTSDQRDLIHQAAQVEGRTLTDFAVAVLLEHANDVLADQRVFRLTGARWSQLASMLDQPGVRHPRLAKAMERADELGR